VKSQDTEAALDTIAPLAGPDTVVVSLQNGMNPPTIAKRLGKERVVGAFVSFPADWQGPGHIELGGVGNIWIGELDGRITERLARIQKLISHSVTPHITDNITGYLWSKQIDCALLFAQTVGDQTFADTFGDCTLSAGPDGARRRRRRRGARGGREARKLRRLRAAEAAAAHACRGERGARRAEPLRRPDAQRRSRCAPARGVISRCASARPRSTTWWAG
jgi:hypothetical protein